MDDLLDRRRALGMDLARTLAEAIEKVHRCPQCNTLTTEPLCAICRQPDRLSKGYFASHLTLFVMFP